MITPKRLTIRGQMRWLAGVLVALFVIGTVVLAYFGVVGDPGSKSPDLDRGGFQIAAAVTASPPLPPPGALSGWEAGSPSYKLRRQ